MSALKSSGVTLDKHGHVTELLSPDLPMGAIVKKGRAGSYDFILRQPDTGIWRFAELLARFVDLLDAAGVRDTPVVIGGNRMTPELAAELGFRQRLRVSQSEHRRNSGVYRGARI